MASGTDDHRQPTDFSRKERSDANGHDSEKPENKPFQAVSGLDVHIGGRIKDDHKIDPAI